ncbi:MAG: ABC transporter ATP-binding protein [Candidatus Heimdallarchaeota archaeon]
MKVYTAGLIDKSQRTINETLRKQLTSDFRKTLRISRSGVSSQELNSFIILSGEKNGKGTFDPKYFGKIEQGRLFKRFRKYYNNNESKLQRALKSNQELRETSQIVKDFIKEIDPNLTKSFDAQLKKIITDLPTSYCEIYSKSYVAMWDFRENQEYRFFLPGFDFPVFTGSSTEIHMDVGGLVDKLIIVNFFAIFLKPTIARLQEMDRVLKRLKLGLEGTHYRTTNQKLQTKLELFFRILAAKLSALQDIDNVISRIFDLFEVPRVLLCEYHFHSDFQDFNTALTDISAEIESGKALLIEVRDKLRNCQIRLRDYLDDRINGVRSIESKDEFNLALLPMAELSVDLFVEAELLKMWSDFFGSDIPFFSFNTQLFDTEDRELIEIADDTIFAVRGLFKNYNLGQTTVYALRGVNLDIKEGEFVAIVGNSGAGKTTLLNCMAGLDTPDHGMVLFRGKNLHGMKDSTKSRLRLLEMGFIFQSYALLPHYTTRENVALPADLAGLSKDLRVRIEALLEGVGIDLQAEQFPAQLSGGEMQRVAIARALTNRPTVIFADEPTGDLDSVIGKQVMDLIKKFHEETKTTIVLITHEEDIADYAKRQVEMADGMITRS